MEFTTSYLNNLSICLRGFLIMLSFTSCEKESAGDRMTLATAIENSIKTEMLNQWYPSAVDSVHGGFLSTFTFDWRPTGSQDKMIVTQARHTWSCAKASLLYPDNPVFLKSAEHGFTFLRDVMWDKEFGGFFNLVNRSGQPLQEMKTAYGNAFGIYALSAYYEATRDTSALRLVKEAFAWLEQYSHDRRQKGYYQHLDRDGKVMVRPDTIESMAEIGLKDQNSSIHLLEAFTALYQIWPDSLVKERLQEMLFLIRDTMVNDKGYLVLFFQPDWTPVSFRESSIDVIEKHHNLDHVSFGHDVETAYLMLEASHVLGIKSDVKTQRIAKKMIDHALDNGWDYSAGGFYDEGYYFKDSIDIFILRDTKNWWAQAEGLNTLLLMAELYPQDEHDYFEKFKILWKYIDTNLIDHEYGDWFAGGLDKQPEMKSALKGHIWKGNYHQFRSLSNCVKMLRGQKS
ncbi:MAG: AGE family epimerase/isomerase [Cyclobacteriaceae bacterium]|nr:AGE family epimerase/isomerase [Cyclobacteriaceae bacterium]